MTKESSGRVEIFLKGGLGNQLFQYAAARGLAKHLGGLQIILNLSYLSRSLQRLMSVTVRGFELREFIDNPSVRVCNGSVIQAFRQKALKLRGSSPEWHRFYEQQPTFDERFWRLSAPTTLEGYFHSHLYFENVAERLRAEFLAVSGRARHLSIVLEKIKASNALGVHIRRGDFLKNSSPALLSSDYYRQSIEFALEQTSAKSVYFFSDDPGWVGEQDFSRMGQVIADETASTFDAFLALSACDHFVTANSSFSWWAAWLGNNPQKRVFSPRDWFSKPQETPLSFFPDSWTLLPNR